jgi:hypothetical protein
VEDSFLLRAFLSGAARNFSAERPFQAQVRLSAQAKKDSGGMHRIYFMPVVLNDFAFGQINLLATIGQPPWPRHS